MDRIGLIPPVKTEATARLRRIGHVVAIGALVCAVVIVVSAPVIWTNDHLIHRWVAWPSPLGMRPITITFDTRMVGMLLGLAASLPVLYALVQLSRLFAAFAIGHIFEDDNAVRIRHIGIALIVRAVIAPPVQILTTLNLTINNPPDARTIGFEIEAWHLMTVLGGLALIAFASVMRDAARISQENREIV